MTVIHMNIIIYLMAKDINNTAYLIENITSFIIETVIVVYLIY